MDRGLAEAALLAGLDVEDASAWDRDGATSESVMMPPVVGRAEASEAGAVITEVVASGGGVYFVPGRSTSGTDSKSPGCMAKEGIVEVAALTTVLEAEGGDGNSRRRGWPGGKGTWGKGRTWTYADDEEAPPSPSQLASLGRSVTPATLQMLVANATVAAEE